MKVKEDAFSIQANTIDRASKQNGNGISLNVAHTLNTEDRHAVCYAVDSRNFRIECECNPTIQAKSSGGQSLNFINAVLYENHAQDSRCTGPHDTAPTVAAKFGTGGGNTPLIVSKACHRNEDENTSITAKTMRVRCGKAGGGKDPLVQEEASGTLSTNNDQILFQPRHK